VAVRQWAKRAATGIAGGVVLALLTLPTAHGAPRATPAGDDAPLRISITGLAPGVLPRHGPLVVTGTLTNDDTVDWSDVILYPYLDTDACVATASCSPPMRTTAELADGAASDPTSPVGERIVDPAVMQTVDRVAPGQSVPFRLTIPQRVLREQLGTPDPGVYWFGVQALGQSETTPRDKVSDGRARTFLPYVPDGFGAADGGPVAVDTAVVVPVRAPIRYLRDGRISSSRSWLRALGPNGSLGGALTIGEASGTAPMTWLVDPAVLDAVRQLADGNPARLVAAPGQDPSASPSATTLSTGTGDQDDDGPLPTRATSWLDEARRDLGLGQLLSLPYGDPQLTSSTATAGLYRAARAQDGVLADWKLAPRRAVTGPDGYLDPSGLAAVKDRSIALVRSGQLRRPTDGGIVGGHPFVTLSQGAAGGGPGPNDQYAAIAVRQRILSEVALHLLGRTSGPLVVQLPAEMGAGHADAFWTGLSQPWLHLTDLDTALRDTRPGSALVPDQLRPRKAGDADEEAVAAQSAAEQLIDTGNLLQSIITTPHAAETNTHLADTVVREALASTSYSLRGDAAAASRLDRARSWLLEQLAGVTISAPPGVTLSSAEGSFSVTVNNTLDVPVSVRIAADASGAHIDKTEPVQLAAHSRASVRLDVHTDRAGVHNVRLNLTDNDGTAIGSSVTVPIRSGSVGVVIWAILGSGAGILFAAIVIRLRRRVRLRPRMPGGAV